LLSFNAIYFYCKFILLIIRKHQNNFLGLLCYVLYFPALFQVRLDYILSLRQPTFSRWTAFQTKRFVWNLAADNPFPFVHQFRFYHTTSHYLCHEWCYHIRLVKIALGCSRNLMIYSSRLITTYWPKWILTPFLINFIRPAILVSVVFH
jgi:hypothetical protein